MSGYVVILLFLFLVLLKCPVGLAFLVPSVLYFTVTGLPDSGLASYLIANTQSYTILAIPLFIFVGCLMNNSGVTDYLFTFCNVLVGRFRGGLAYVNILNSLLFAGCSGSALADIGGVGKAEMYAMDKAGYRREDTIGLTGASATVGPIFPPSIPIMIFAMAAEASSSKLLVAGIVPAFLIVIALCVYVFIVGKRNGFPADTTVYSRKEKREALVKSLPAVLLPMILMIGLLSGTLGATALSAIACILIIVIGSVLYRQMKWKDILTASKEALRTTGNIMFIMCTACVFARVLVLSRVTTQVAALLLGISTNDTVLLLMSVAFLLILGMFVDASAAILVSTPILLPVMNAVGVNTIHFGLVMVLTLMIGLLTPPVGMSLYVLSDVSNEPLNRVVRGVVPYYIPLMVVLLLIVFIPELTTFLPFLFT